MMESDNPRTSARERNGAPVTLPTLSPAFLNPDDAARFAHELIGDRRNVEYGGAILKDRQGRYFATRPVRGKATSFNPELIMARDAGGAFIQPAGYTCYAFYHSHPDNYDALQAHFGHWSAPDIHLQVSFFSVNDLLATIINAEFAPAHYLSGVNGSLIKYVTSGSALERALLLKLYKDIRAGVQSFDSMTESVRAVAEAGTLTVIQSMEVWGARVGRLSGAFKALPVPHALALAPVIVQFPAFGPVCSSIELALKYARRRMYRTADPHYGVILKHRERQAFVVSEPITQAMDFSLDRALGRDPEGRSLMPAGYSAFGFYGCDGLYRDPSLIPAQQASVFKNFMHPDALQKGIAAAQAHAGPGATQALPLYIATRDGALLEYVSHFLAVEHALFARLSAAEGGGLSILRDLLAGVETVQGLIRSLASAGQLSVLQTSDVWSTEGRVDAHWQPFSGFERRALSPFFISADDAARYVHARMAGGQDKVYGGLVYQTPDRRFIATEPLASHNETFDPSSVVPQDVEPFIPTEYRVVAAYQSHRVEPLQLWRSDQEEQLARAMFAPHELCAAIKGRHWAPVRYFCAPDGALLKYSASGSAAEKKLLVSLSPPVEHPEQARNNPLQSRLRANSIKPGEYIAQVAGAGQLQVVTGSPHWGVPGTLRATSVLPLSRDEGLEASQPPACGPVFSQVLDAVRDAHRRMGERRGVQYGFILKSNVGAHYVATVPVQSDALSLDKVFAHRPSASGDHWPEGFTVFAMYLAGPARSAFLATDELYQAFVSPRDLAVAMVTLSIIKDQRYPLADPVKLYLSTADGAVLGFLPGNIPRLIGAGSLRNTGKEMIELLASQAETALGYVRKVAASGVLEVLLPSPLWGPAGRISQGWRPWGQTPTVDGPGNTFALGPEFSHEDDAARYAHDQLPCPHVHAVTGAILHNPASSRYVAVEPFRNGAPVNGAEALFLSATFERSTGQLRPLPDFPDGYAPIAAHFSHPPVDSARGTEAQRQLLDNSFAPRDICYVTTGLERLGFSLAHAFHSGNDGSLLKYRRREGEAQKALCEMVPGSDFWDDLYASQQGVDASPKKQRDYLAQLASAGALSVLASSREWPRAGRVEVGDNHALQAAPQTVDWDTPSPLDAIPTPKPGLLRDEI